MTLMPARTFTLCLLAAVAGCGSLPGFDSPGERESSSRWYGRLDQRIESAEAYGLRVLPIDPELILQLNRPSQETNFWSGELPEDPDVGEYVIGPTDILAIIVYGHPDITNPAGLTQTMESSGRVVDSNGQIFVPFAGNLEVAGLTATGVRNLITDRLSRVINDPQVDVRVMQFRSQKVFVTGDLEQPCTVPVTDAPLSIVDALTMCQAQVTGSTMDIAGVDSVLLLRDGNTYFINLSLLYRSGGGPVLLQNADRLIVDNRFNRVFVIGEFAEQTTVTISAGNFTLADAIAAAGGLDLDTADPGAIFVLRGVIERELTDEAEGTTAGIRADAYHLDARSVDAMILADQFELQPRDIVYAAPASLVNFNRALAQLTPSIDALFRTVIIFDRIND